MGALTEILTAASRAEPSCSVCKRKRAMWGPLKCGHSKKLPKDKRFTHNSNSIGSVVQQLECELEKFIVLSPF